MPGAVIPSDWDGLTFACVSLLMPDSVEYRAFLLGLQSAMAELSFWDDSTGDVTEATEAMDTAYQETLDNYYSECPEMPIYRFKAFRAKLSQSQSIPAATWTPLNFDSIVYWTNTGAPGEASGYDVNNMGHSMVEGFHGSAEFWRYSIQVAFQNYTGVIGLRFNTSINQDNYFDDYDNNYARWSTTQKWVGESNVLRPEVYITSAGTVEPSQDTTWFEGMIGGRLL